jgi:hypothetical protein
MDRSFVPSPYFDAATLRELFQAEVLLLLLKEGMISEEFVGKIKSWPYSGFHAFAGEEIPDIDTAREEVSWGGTLQVPTDPSVPGLDGRSGPKGCPTGRGGSPPCSEMRKKGISYLKVFTEDGFVRLSLGGLPSYSAYYRYLREVNRRGPRLLREVPALAPLSPA